MKKYANYFLYMFITFILICVTSCGSGAGGTSNTDSNIDSGQLQMSSLVYLPKSGTNSATTLIYNGTNTSLVLSTATANGQSIYPSNTTSSIPPTNVTSCANVLQNDYCKITINNNENTQNLALSFVFVDKNGKKYTTTQNVIYTDTSYLSGDFYLIGQSSNSIDVMKTPQGLKMSALTFELNSNYESNSLNVSSSNHSVTVTSPLCSGYTKGSLCTVNFNLDSTINDNTSIPIIISGTVQNTSTSFMNKLQQSLIKLTDIEPTATLNVNVNNIPNLIASPTNVVI